MSCGVGRRCGLTLAWLWLRCVLVGIALIQPSTSSLGTPICNRCGPKKTKKKKKKRERENVLASQNLSSSPLPDTTYSLRQGNHTLVSVTIHEFCLVLHFT